MQGYRQPYQSQKDKNKFGQQQCPLGWNCQKIIANNCKLKHDPNDKEDIEALNRIKKNKVIVITDTYFKNEIRPICLFEIYLPIKLVPNEKIRIQVGKYYVGQFETVQNRSALIKIEDCLGNFGNWKIQRNLYQDYLPPIFQKCKPNENYREKRGKIRVNGVLKKVLQGEQGLRLQYSKVNQKCKYPLLDGSEVSYFQKNKVVQISRIKYPIYQKFSGILQVDGRSQFYFIARSETFDEMNPYRIPEELIAQLRDLTHTLPYTLLKKQKLKNEVKDKMNNILKTYLVKGEFEQWPMQSNYPIIALENQVQLRNFQSQKQGIVYETGIAIKSFTKNQKKQSEKLSNKFKLKDYEKRKRFKDKIYTVDGKNTKCHDDALYIEELEDGGFIVEVHIADIAAIVKSQSALDKDMRERDATLYIKDYFQPMIHQSLRNKVSLKSGGEKLALTLSFNVDKEGSIDFSSVRFINSIIQVQQNLTHQRLEKGTEKYPELFQLSECLSKGPLIRQRSLIEHGLQSELGMSRIIELSSLIPTVMMQMNISKSKEFRKNFNDYLKKIIEQKQKQMESWQIQVEKINKVQHALKLTEKKEKDLKNLINKDLSKERQNILKKIKEQLKANSQEEKKQKKVKMKIMNGIDPNKELSQNESEQFSDEEVQTELANDEKDFSVGVSQLSQLEGEFDLSEVLMKEKRAKALKEMKKKENFDQMISSEQQTSQDDSDMQISLNEGYRMTKAMGGKNFMEKILSHFGIKLTWLRESQINEAFRKILSLDKGKLYQEYFKRLQITNRQHFPYIIKAARKQAPEEEWTHKKNRRQNGQNKDQTDYKKERKQTKQLKEIIREKKQQKQEPETILSCVDDEKSKFYKKKQSEKNKAKEIRLEKSSKNLKQYQRQKNEISIMPASLMMGNPPPNMVSQMIPMSMNAELPLAHKIPMTLQMIKPMTSIQLKDSDVIVTVQFEVHPQQTKFVSEGTKDQKIKPSNDMPARIKVQTKNTQIEKKTHRMRKRRSDKQTSAFSEIETQKFNQLLKQFEISQKQVSDKYYHLIRNGKNFDIQITEQQKKVLQENTEDFETKYRRHKRDTVIKMYQQIKKKNQASQLKKERVFQGLDQNSKTQTKEKIKGQDKLKITQGNKKGLGKRRQCKAKNTINNQQKLIQTKAQTNVQLFVQVNSQTKAQTGVQVKVQAQVCQSMVQITNQAKVQFKIQTELQRIEKINPTTNLQAPVNQKDDEEETKNEGLNIEVKQNVTSVQEPKSTTKKSKKNINKMVQQLMKPITEEIKLKYTQKLEQLSEQIKKLRTEQQSAGKLLKLELQKSKIHFNLIRLMASQDIEKQQSQSQNQTQSDLDDEENTKGRKRKTKKKNKKNKKSKKSKKKTSEKSIFSQILQIFQSYADKSKYKFQRMDDEQLDDFLKKQLSFKSIEKQEDDSLEKVNEEAVKITAEQFILKWNNPIRNYESLMVMRLIKEHYWLFQGNVFPTEIVKYGDQLKEIERKLKKIRDYHDDKVANGQNDKKVREANREIDYLQFYYKLKKNPDQVFTFLNITSPTPRLKRVFHETLGDVDLENSKFAQVLYKQVKGKVKIVRDFPIKLKVEIIQ